MRYISALILAVGFALSRSASSQSAASTWVSEPSTFWGAKFGAPLSSSFRECAKESFYGHSRYVANADSPTCFEDDGRFRYVKHLSSFPDILVQEVDGKVEDVQASRPSAQADETLVALTSRFGPAHEMKTIQVTTRAGVSYTDHRYIWQGKNVTITFDTVGSNVTECDVAAFTQRWMQQLFAEQQRKAAGTAATF